MLCLWSAPLFVTDHLWRSGTLTELLLPSFLECCNYEFLWEFFLVFLERLGWFRCSSIVMCEALCDIACKKGYTNQI